MSRLPCKVFLENSSTNLPEAQHPRLPRARLFGILEPEPAGLVFRPILFNAFANKGGSQPHPRVGPIVFPWQHITHCLGVKDHMLGPGAGTAALLSFFSLGLMPTGRAYIALMFWDEEWELQGTALFSLYEVAFNKQSVAEATAYEILSHRSNYKRQLKDAVTPMRR